MTNAQHPTLAWLACAAALLVVACTTMPTASHDNAARYAEVINNPVRTEQDRRMDDERKPAQFLPFTQVEPGMRVMDVSAGGGYTSQLLALAVGPNGTLYAQTPRPGATLTQRLADHRQANFVLVERPFVETSKGTVLARPKERVKEGL